MDNVELFRMSQINTHKAAIRFEYATRRSSSIKNCVVHHSRANAFNSHYSSLVFVEKTAFVGVRSIGVLVTFSSKIIFD